MTFPDKPLLQYHYTIATIVSVLLLKSPLEMKGKVVRIETSKTCRHKGTGYESCHAGEMYKRPQAQQDIVKLMYLLCKVLYAEYIHTCI